MSVAPRAPTPDSGPKTWDPDWTIAPSEILWDWLDENGLTPETFAVACAGRERKRWALWHIRRVLARKPFALLTADILARGTHVSPEFWRALEHMYRRALREGKRDDSDA